MRNSVLTKLLVGLVVLSVVGTASLAYLYVRSVQKLNRLQFQTAVINRNRSLINALANETVEYSKHNPAIDAVLQSVGIKPKAGAATTQSPFKP